MDVRQIPRWAIAAVALAVVFGIGSLLYNSGYSSGMVTGLLVSGSEGGAMNPYLLSRTGGLHGGFGFFGGLLKFVFFLFFLGMIAKFLGFARWKMHGRWNSEGNGSEHAFSPHHRGMWEAHRAWHQAEEQAPTASASTEEPTAAVESPATPVEEK